MSADAKGAQAFAAPCWPQANLDGRGGIGGASRPSVSGRLTTQGKFLFLNGEKFFARGVTYGPFAPNSRGERFPEPARASADFALLRELGANVVRTYVVPPPWWMELAAQAGVRVMVGVAWPSYMMVLESRVTAREIRAAIAGAVRAMKPWREAIFAYALGNEIRADVLRYHGARKVRGFLRELYDLGKNIDADGLFTYANYPSTEYLAADFLDFLCFNLFLHHEVDFRRYLGHLMALSGPLPLVLSEAGADTLRAGETFQARLLAGQIRAAWEIGLSGFLVFAFTDEWHTGGSEIDQWAFGLVSRQRQRKAAFSVVADSFRNELPPPLQAPPMVSIVVAARNAERTLGACLTSLRRLHYPRFEIIVVDDGSDDATAAVARSFAVRLLRTAHRGLSAARNLGIRAASGEIIAFIDADATADVHWLHYLVGALRSSGAAAVGGPNFPPPADSMLRAAIAAAPGQPREVFADAQRLAQLCGCNMAIAKSALDGIGGFDDDFVAAGDDVDLSWRLRQHHFILAAAPGAVVLHERRATLRAYLAQQIGYGRAEALLAAKRSAYPASISAGAAWDVWLRHAVPSRPRIYYGRHGRGLFQAIYPADGVECWITLHPGWIAASALLLCSHDPIGFALGVAAVVGTLLSAACYGFSTPLARRDDRLIVRAMVTVLALLGPIARSAARVQLRMKLAVAGKRP